MLLMLFSLVVFVGCRSLLVGHWMLAFGCCFMVAAAAGGGDDSFLGQLASNIRRLMCGLTDR